MQYCCVQFFSLCNEAGTRGVGLIVDASETKPAFFLQWRGMENGEDTSSLSSAVPLELATELGILFCPWCGVDLNKFYRKCVGQMSRPDLRLSRSGPGADRRDSGSSDDQ